MTPQALTLEEWIRASLKLLEARTALKVEGVVPEGRIKAYRVGPLIRIDLQPWSPVPEEVEI